MGVPLNSTSPSNPSSSESSVNDTESLVSLMSTQSAQYEDIDDPLQANLTSLDEIYDSILTVDHLHSGFHLSSRRDGSELRYLDELMIDSHCSASDSNSTMTNSMMQDDATQSISSTTTVSPQHNAEKWKKSTDVGNPVVYLAVKVTYIVNLINTIKFELKTDAIIKNEDNVTVIDSVMETPTESTKESKTLRARCNDLQHEERSSILLAEGMGMSLCDKILEVKQIDVGVDEISELEADKSANALTTSCVDSGIGGTISTHSELSGFCLSPLVESFPEVSRTSRSVEELRLVHRRTCEMDIGSLDDNNISFADIPLSVPDGTVPDEVFVSKFVLAEQVSCTQMPSNPLTHKMTIVPTRNLLVGSFIFSIPQMSGSNIIHAISFLMNNVKQDWYMERQSFFESVVLDTVPKLKASIIAEPWEDVVIRANIELTRLLNLISILDRYPLVSESCSFIVKNTLLMERRCQNDKVLLKAISGILQSQGQCVIIGSDTVYVNRLLHTLAAFVPQQLRWCCLRMYRHKFSPYIRLQAVQRYELPYVMQYGALANWPICIVDVDHSTVCMSAQYSRHRIIKQKADAQRVEIILNNNIMSKPVTLEISPCRILECVRVLIRRIDALPYEQSARMGLVNQLLLYVENMARAFILYVQHASEPLPAEKSSATKSSRFSLSECRRALDLQSDGWFHAVLARAELLLPNIAEFVYTST
ncbi:hypothetical protein DICVIV_01848 [Dictyocaulus viviparus]|uniref:Uncharacterized protein n=1 Tax=Dictyocaulus viviparus TaxID=29172 RepID=A0A0D8Y6Y0_DICVI|nr:hypothetical protein DICVIV_01848 [Dictyocaulus viviparus]